MVTSKQDNNHFILSADNTNQDGCALYRRSDPVYVRILICFTLQSYHTRKLIFERLYITKCIGLQKFAKVLHRI